MATTYQLKPLHMPGATVDVGQACLSTKPVSPLLLAEPRDVPECSGGLDDPRYPYGHQRPDQERKELVGGLLLERGA